MAKLLLPSAFYFVTCPVYWGLPLWSSTSQLQPKENAWGAPSPPELQIAVLVSQVSENPILKSLVLSWEVMSAPVVLPRHAYLTKKNY
jgi:hypothetical protein